ncbi:DNA-binding transcriptional regulator, ArsR family [Quadrisphaera granulorum]|uniref:DNA-binding transcriptional ArsR family regulator n=1 Tax=Quadrisphaera granulorum TaxID=317664 RepID=A0A315ZRI0_9ACTN|nr:helix-turn-helix domain-containing protein [Quadrisphaera granulorum]PWJ47610.1 DNA-binding transcriptional ArsR family regulator [Quadrisphaera granulorum]SZE98740.1 DNA-binding transcriptional regulator, ArsR family [Quadrisphaera granulorum]
MSPEPDIAVPARALGEPARARIAAALLSGRQVPAGQLAQTAGVAVSTASEHLAVLLAAGIVQVEHQGRQRLYRLASDDVARAVEALQVIAPSAPVRSLRQARVSVELRAARTCYDHLAGDLGLHLTDVLVEAHVIPPLHVGMRVDAPEPFPAGPLVELLGVHPGTGPRPWARGCLDWTGRRAHVAGQVGAQVLEALVSNGWVLRRSDTRAVRVTDTGQARLLGLTATRQAAAPDHAPGEGSAAAGSR